MHRAAFFIQKGCFNTVGSVCVTGELVFVTPGLFCIRASSCPAHLVLFFRMKIGMVALPALITIIMH